MQTTKGPCRGELHAEILRRLYCFSDKIKFCYILIVDNLSVLLVHVTKWSKRFRVLWLFVARAVWRNIRRQKKNFFSVLSFLAAKVKRPKLWTASVRVNIGCLCGKKMSYFEMSPKFRQLRDCIYIWRCCNFTVMWWHQFL